MSKAEFVGTVPNRTSLLPLLDSKLLRARMEEINFKTEGNGLKGILKN
jgi:hypothetical protein